MEQYALKFFLSEKAFIQEKGLYLDDQAPLGEFLPQLHSIKEGNTSLTDSQGNALPPCIVMERGESLDTWVEVSCGSKLDIFTGLQVRLCNVVFHT